MPPRRASRMAVCSAASRSIPAFSIMGRARASGSSPASFWAPDGRRRAVRLHTHGVDRGVGAPAVGEVVDRHLKVVDRRDVDHLDAVPTRHRQALRHEVQTDHPPGPAVGRDARGHLADRPQPHDDHAAARRDLGVLDGLPRRGQDVREVQVALVRESRRPARPPGRTGPAALAGTAPARPGPARRAWCTRTAPRPCPARGPGSSRTGRSARACTSSTSRTAIPKGTTTRSPTLSRVAPAPTSSTTPIASWPRMSPLSRYMPRTPYRCRSEPQIAVDVTRTIASVACSMRGSGTVPPGRPLAPARSVLARRSSRSCCLATSLHLREIVRPPCPRRDRSRGRGLVGARDRTGHATARAISGGSVPPGGARRRRARRRGRTRS